MNALPGFPKALTEYQSGNYGAALSAAEDALLFVGDQERQMLLPLKASIHLKLGDKRSAARAFVEAATHLPEKQATFLKFAATLFSEIGMPAEVMAIARDAAAANAGDSNFVLTLATACKQAGNLLAARPFIADLDLSKSAHFALFNEFERSFGSGDDFYAFLAEACSTRPGNILLNSMRYSKARVVCDLPVLEEFDRQLADTDSPVAQGPLQYELALFRLMRTDDERMTSLPTYETMGRQAPIQTVRRPISTAGEKLRIGYLSNDFFAHATMRLFEEAMQGHDRQKFDIKLFCYTHPRDAAKHQQTWPDWLRDAVLPVGHLTDAAAAQVITEQGVDILVDLKGHTAGARLGIIKISDAPVKVTYLGFPGPLTGAAVDYALTDRSVTPDSSKPFYAEKLCRLPETYQANGSTLRPRPAALGRGDFGLPEGKLILGTFNAAQKITPATVRLWAKIMRQLPDALLAILCKDGLARQNLLAGFRQENIDPAQIVFMSNEPYARYLSRIGLVDLALDTHPYNGHTTTSDILWAGMPLVTFKGQGFASRVSESLLLALDLPELVATDEAGYCRLAVDLARDADKRQAIAARLKRNRVLAPLFDTERFVRHLERAYESMAERVRNGLPPDHIDIEPLPSRHAAFMEPW